MNLKEWTKWEGVHPVTAYRWFREGKLPVPARRVGRLLLVEQPSDLVAAETVVVYARGPSADQQADLDRQVARVTAWATGQNLAVSRVVTEVGSAPNGRREKFRALLRDVTEILTSLCALAEADLTPWQGWSLPDLRRTWNQIKQWVAPWWTECSKEAFNTGLANPSSKTCSACLTVKPKLSLAERTFHCDACGMSLNRDVNAAHNLAALVRHVDLELPGDAKTGRGAYVRPVRPAPAGRAAGAETSRPSGANAARQRTATNRTLTNA